MTTSDTRDLRPLFESVSNWGRWGDNDEAGTLNLIGPAERVRGMATVTEGISIGCSRETVTVASENNANPAGWSLIKGDVVADEGVGVAADRLTVAPHGPDNTHLDALCHVSFDGRIYNGRPASVVGIDGVRSHDLTPMVDGVVSRGVLLDIPAVRGLDYIPADQPILPEELDAAERAAGITVGAGDILAVYGGREARVRAEGRDCEYVDGRLALAGMVPECLTWLRERDIGVLMSDGGSDFLPRIGDYAPIHVGALVYMGLPLVDNASFDRLATECRALSRWEFAFMLAPQRWYGTTGAVINPIALL